MAKRYVMTAKRRAALRKAQLASARKRRGKASKHLKKHRKKYAVAGAAVVGTAAYQAYDRKKNVRLYHTTGKSASKSIRKNGFIGAHIDHYGPEVAGRVYFSTNKKGSTPYGSHTVRVKMSRIKFAKVSQRDILTHYRKGKPLPHFTVHHSDLAGHKIRSAVRVPRGASPKAFIRSRGYDDLYYQYTARVKNAAKKVRKR